MESILKYFSDLTTEQSVRLEALGPLYQDWNEKINLVSRKDISFLYEKHILHSLAVAKWITFAPGTEILDLGTGGGFPGIPLAILFPDTQFTLIDARAKKIKVVHAIAEQLGMKNVTAYHRRAEDETGRYDFVVSRAVTDLATLWRWSSRLVHLKHKHPLPNGMIVFKGGDLSEEIKALPAGTYSEMFEIATCFEEPYFAQKRLVYLQK